MQFLHTPDIWSAFPTLVAGAIHVEGVRGCSDFDDLVPAFVAAARNRLSGGEGNGHTPVPEGQWPEIQAWRRVYAQMGLPPTQVRCAAEALLRRLRQSGSLPRVHPLVDLCNAVSVHAAAPIAVFDCARVAWPMAVARARGTEDYLAFSGDVEQPVEGEVIYVDATSHAHARKWAHRQSRQSAVTVSTDSVLIVVEAVHADAERSVSQALRALDDAFGRTQACARTSQMLSAARPEFLQPNR